MAGHKPIPAQISPERGAKIPSTPAAPFPPNRPSPSRAAESPKRWQFSFRFWRQIDFFGLGDQDAKWFVSLLDKLAELSKESIDRFRSDIAKRDAWRYHEIDWTQTNIPLQRSDLTWLDSDYRDNDAEYPLYQFQVSTALGRVVGFWDETDVFNVVLLDPLHNIQPSKRFDYRVSKTTPLPCVYTSLLFKLREIQKHRCTGEGCPVPTALNDLPGEPAARRVLILQIDDDSYRDALAALDLGTADSVAALLKAGIDSLIR